MLLLHSVRFGLLLVLRSVAMYNVHTVLLSVYIIDSVESIGRDRVDTQYMPIQKYGQCITYGAFMTTYHSSSSVSLPQRDSQYRGKPSQKYHNRKSPNHQNRFLQAGLFKTA